jgi:MFS family permease
MGLNEFAGYVAVAAAAYFTAIIADQYGLRPAPFYLGVGLVVAGFLLSVLFVKETHHLITIETDQSSFRATQRFSFKEVFVLTSWKDKNLFSCSQAGLVNNLNDGVAWGVFPIFFSSLGISLHRIGMLVGLYPLVWGMTQLVTGPISDKVGRKWMIVCGMWVQAVGLGIVASVSSLKFQVIAMVLLGFGTAMVYPTLLAAVSDGSYPSWRASAVGVYRLWRDLGYALGAILSGIIADTFGVGNAIFVVGILTFLSGVITALDFHERNLLKVGGV